MSNVNPVENCYGSSLYYAKTSQQTTKDTSGQKKYVPENANNFSLSTPRTIASYNPKLYKSLSDASQGSFSATLSFSLDQINIYLAEAKINIEKLFKPLISENTKFFMYLSNEKKLEKTCDLVEKHSLTIDKTTFINGINEIITEKDLTPETLRNAVFNFLYKHTKSPIASCHFISYYEFIIDKSDDRNILEVISLALSFDFFITTKAKLKIREVSTMVNNLTILAFSNLGLNPWIIFDLSAEQFNFICKFNKLLARKFLTFSYDFMLFPGDKHPKSIITTMINNILFSWAKFIPTAITNKAITNKDLIHYTQISFETVFIYQIINLVLEKNSQESNLHKPILNVDKLFLGVECEFNRHKSLKMKNLSADKCLDLWKNIVSEQAQSMSINFNLEDIDNLDYINFHGWGYKVFFDSPEVLEITPTPYRYQQEYINDLVIQGQKKTYKIEDAFNSFIFDIAKISELQGLSGHRHVDIRAFASSPEMLLRLYINFQTYTFMPKIFERIDSLEHFAYLTNKEPYLVDITNQIITNFNEAISKQEWTSKTGSYKSSAELAVHLCENIPLARKQSPLALHHIKPQDPGEPSVKGKPTSTMEFRFPPCPKDFKDMALFDELLVAEIKATERDIKNKVPLKPISQRPECFTKQQAISSFNEYLDNRGLDPEIFKTLIR